MLLFQFMGMGHACFLNKRDIQMKSSIILTKYLTLVELDWSKVSGGSAVTPEYDKPPYRCDKHAQGAQIQAPKGKVSLRSAAVPP